MAPDCLHEALDTLVISMAATDLSHGEIVLTWPATPRGMRVTLTLDVEEAADGP